MNVIQIKDYSREGFHEGRMYAIQTRGHKQRDTIARDNPQGHEQLEDKLFRLGSSHRLQDLLLAHREHN